MNPDALYVSHHLLFFFLDIIVVNAGLTSVTTAVNMMREQKNECVTITNFLFPSQEIKKYLSTSKWYNEKVQQRDVHQDV